MMNLNKKVISSLGIIALICLAPSMTFAKGHSGKSGKHGDSGQHGKSGKSGKSGKHGNHGNHGDHGKSGNWGGGNGDPLSESCTPCKGGLSAMILRNDGPSADVSIQGGKHGHHNKHGGSGKSGKHGGSGKSGKHGKHGGSGKSGKHGNNAFSEYVEAGDTFTYSTNGKMNNSISINGAYIHTSCSKPINAGMKIGDFTLVSATSARTGEVLCTLPNAPQPNETGSVCGVVYNDLNNNGTQDNGEEGTRGIVVSVLDANGDTQTAKTRITGSYCVKDVVTGNATVTVKESTLPAKANLTAGDNPSDVVVKANIRNDAGKDGYIFAEDPINETGKVCGVVFLDTNANDKFDNSDELLNNVTVNVKNSNGNNIASETTNSAGKYCISDIPAGRVTVDVDEGTLPENSGQVVGEDPTTLTVKAGENNWAGRDGYGKPDVAPKTGKVCGIVFHDVNKNGQKDANEDGSAGILIKVLTKSGNAVKGETATGGNYCISDVPKGSVEVTVVESTLPDGAKLTVGTNPTSLVVVPNQENNAGEDGYAGDCTCDCSLCQGGTK